MQMDWDMGYTRDLVRQQAERIAELEKRINDIEDQLKKLGKKLENGKKVHI